MPEEYLESRTTDPATWMRTPEKLKRLSAFVREAAALPPRACRAEARERADAIGPAGQQNSTPAPPRTEEATATAEGDANRPACGQSESWPCQGLGADRE
jgi:hypothetical protein